MFRILIFYLLLSISCNVERKKVPEPLTIQRNIINLGTEEDPNNFYVDYIGNLNYKKIIYKNIYGFSYKSQIDSTVIDTTYYETFDRIEGINLSTFKIELWQGDANIKITDNRGANYSMFYMLENTQYRHIYKNKTFDDLPTISLNKKGEYVSENSLNFSINKIDNGNYEITFKEFSKVYSVEYKLIGGELTKLSFLNRTNGYIYSIDKKVYLKPIKKVSFIDYH